MMAMVGRYDSGVLIQAEIMAMVGRYDCGVLI